MRINYAPLRILVLVGCLPLLTRDAQVMKVFATTEQCSNFNFYASVPACPSGCTGQYTTYTWNGGNGFGTSSTVATPCPSGSCTQPVAWAQPTYNCQQPPCCIGTSAPNNTCVSDECGPNFRDPCCSPAHCEMFGKSGICCIADGLRGCNNNDDCCNYDCNGGLCGCLPNGQSCYGSGGCCNFCNGYTCCSSDLGEGCNGPQDCCTIGAECPAGRCCLQTGMSGCSNDSDCCDSSAHCQNGKCECGMGAPVRAGLLPLLWH